MALVDRALAVERKVVEVFGYGDMGKQLGRGEALDHADRGRCDDRGKRLVGDFPILGPDDPLAVEARRVHFHFESLLLANALVAFGIGLHFLGLDHRFF